MDIANLLAPDRVICNAEAKSKKRVLEALSELLERSQPATSATELFDSLVSRERLGSTGLGRGVALPHARVQSVEAAAGAFIKLAAPIDFDAADNRPVDLLFALLVPEQSTDEHLHILAGLAELFSDQGYCEQLRSTRTDEELYRLLAQRSVQRKLA